MGLRMQYISKIKISALIFLITPFTAMSENIAVPNSFSSGTTIKSSEMNDNFSVITDGINSNSGQILSIKENLTTVETNIEQLKESLDTNSTKLDDINATLSAINESVISIEGKLSTAALPKDQLICRGNPRNQATETLLCLQASDSSNTRDLTMAQIFTEGWIAISIGGSGDYWSGYIFQK
jgi:septal ring factor EnvC (AmiA/AmiB activator)